MPWAVAFHFLAAGFLFTAAIASPDPVRHRAPLALRGTVLVLALAAHGVLAKQLCAFPPAGIPVAEAEVGAMLMYYAGDVVDGVPIFALCLEWYRRSDRQLARSRQRQGPLPV